MEAGAERLVGELLGFTYLGEGGYAVARVAAEEGEVVAVGSLGHLLPGQRLLLEGRWEEHPRYGRRFRAESVLADEPASLEGLQRYLAGALPGVGPALARRMVEVFGSEVLELLDREPERLAQVPGIGPATVRRIREAWRRHRDEAAVQAELRGLGLGDALARQAAERWGRRAPALLRAEPYRLLELERAGFARADALARELGLPPEAPERVRAALLHLLERAAEEGHCALPLGELRRRAAALGVERGIERTLEQLALAGELHLRPGPDPELSPVQLARWARWEDELARRLAALLRLRRPLAATPPARGDALGVELDPEQRLAVELALSGGLVVVTGGPGTGKTTLVRAFLAEARRRGERWLLAAPTGRAARRLAESTRAEASTLHRLLGWSFAERRFLKGPGEPLEADGVLVDEASMLDLPLARHLLRALRPGARLVLVGDDHQLPPVGPGQPLADLVESAVAPVVRLSRVHRQAARSGIVRNAHRVDRGELPVSAEREGGERDFFVVLREDERAALDTLLEIAGERLPRLGFDPQKEVQVLVPMHRGLLGTENVNAALQELLNPGGRELRWRGRRFRAGDRVIQTRNDYRLGVFNGEVGEVLEVEEDGLLVDFDGRSLSLVGEQLERLELAYAITVHKAQGSEYPAVVVLLHRAHYPMLRRRLLYTAISRARRFCCVLGSAPALRRAVAETGGGRYTLLAERLREAARGG